MSGENKLARLLEKTKAISRKTSDSDSIYIGKKYENNKRGNMYDIALQIADVFGLDAEKEGGTKVFEEILQYALQKKLEEQESANVSEQTA